MSIDSETRLRELEDLIANGQFGEVENVWMEAIGEGVGEVSVWLALAEKMARQEQQHKACVLLELLVDPLIARGAADTACEVVNEAAILDGNNWSLKESAQRAYGARFAEIEGYDDVLAKAEADKGNDPGGYVAMLRECCTYLVGDYLFHDAGWGLGKVVGLDLPNRKLTVDFVDEKGHEVDLEAATGFFRRLPPGHLLSRKAEDIKAVKAQAADDPIALMVCAMKSVGGKATLKRIKELLSPDVIAKSNWTSWWNDVRKALTRNGCIRVGSGTNPSLELLHISTTQTDEYETALAACHTLAQFAQMLRRYLGETKTGNSDQAAFLTKQLRGFFNRLADDVRLTDGEKLMAKFLLDDVCAANPEVSLTYDLDVSTLAADSERVLAALEPLTLPEYRARLLEIVKDGNPAWSDVYAKALLKLIPEEWDRIAVELREAGEQQKLFAVARTIFDAAETWPEQHMWLCRNMIVGDGASAYGFTLNAPRILGELLHLGMVIFHRVERGDKKFRPLRQKYRNLLAERNNRIVQEVIDSCDEEQARHLLHGILMNRALSEAKIEVFAKIVLTRYPKLAAVEIAEENDDDTGAILTTPGGYRAKHHELNQILNVEIPRIQTAIGEALALGDISENAELESARAKEELLVGQASRIRADLERAKVVKPGEYDTGRAGFGTKVKIRNTGSGEVEHFTILGRWDAGAPGVISDISAIAKGIEKLGVGESQSFKKPDGAMVTYEVLAIEPAEFAAE